MSGFSKHKSLGDCIGSAGLDAPPPRLVTPAQYRAAQRMRDELSGEKAKHEKAKVSLAPIKFMGETGKVKDNG